MTSIDSKIQRIKADCNHPAVLAAKQQLLIRGTWGVCDECEDLVPKKTLRRRRRTPGKGYINEEICLECFKKPNFQQLRRTR